MNAKRFLALAVALILALATAACGQGGIPEPDYDNLPDDYEDYEEYEDSEDSDDESEPAASETAESTAPIKTGRGEAVCALAESLIGTPFRYGAMGPDEFDNSGFVYYCCRQNGIDLPRKTADMAGFGRAVDKNDLERGDVLIFCNEVGGEPAFVGIYAGGDSFIACNNENSPTKKQSFAAAYWQERFLTARRAG